ncbi:glycosyltransferase family 2 protein [Levilactobacillus namurensis]|uniref:glycosyltransferase family 2 protein n=1 Tax=Levilactobacillus namurensis TaxID=380393 RepID=UPI0026EE45D4|nr:glycosyltransferase family 2 protein [Levilactobacillus namurensis]
MPFFSVMITTYNSQKTIKNTLRSVIQQTTTEYELIIVDDHSVDNTLNIVHRILGKADISYRVIRLSKNLGVSAARNVGILKSKGLYIAFLDDDDVWLPDKLETQKKIIVKKDVDWIFSNYYVIDDSYKKIGKRYRRAGYYDYKRIISNGNPIGMLTSVVKRDILINYPFRKIHHEDYDLWIRLSKKGYVGYMTNDYLAYYMKSESSTSSNKFKSFIWTYSIFRKNESFFKTLYLMFRYCLNVFKRKKKRI